MRFSDQIRREVRRGGLTQYRIWKETGIDASTLSRFMTGRRGLPMKTLDRLAGFLDLSVVSAKGNKSKRS